MKVQDYNIMMIQVRNIEKLSGGEAKLYSTVNSVGKRTRKVVIEWEDEREGN